MVLDPEDGKPRLTGEWLTAREPHVRGAKKEHKERQDAVRGYGAQPDATVFLVLVALWEDRGAELDVLHDALLALARRTPQSGMRSMLPRLEQEARKFFILPARRRRLRELAEALDLATAHLKDLPLTAMASVESTNLPLPTQTLPALREGAEGRGRWVRGRWVRGGWVRGGWVQKLRRFFGS